MFLPSINNLYYYLTLLTDVNIIILFFLFQFVIIKRLLYLSQVIIIFSFIKQSIYETSTGAIENITSSKIGAMFINFNLTSNITVKGYA